MLVDNKYKIRKANCRAEKFCGRDEINGVSCGEALGCIHSTDDRRGCGFGSSCGLCILREKILHTINNNYEHQQIPATMTVVDKKGHKSELHFLISTTPVISGEQRLAQVCLLDVTENRKAEEAGYTESRRAQQYLDIAGVIIVININGIVTLINKKGCEVLGYPEEEIVGKNWFENFIPAQIRPEILNIASQVLSEQNESSSYHENVVLTKTGEERLIAWNNTIVRDNNGEIVAHISSGADITENKQNEIERQIAQQETEVLLRATREVLLGNDFLSAAQNIYNICAAHIGAAKGYWRLKNNAIDKNNADIHTLYNGQEISLVSEKQESINDSIIEEEIAKRCRVLVVDDEESIRKAIIKMLSEHDVVQANGGAEAKSIIEKDQNYNLILCDVMMSNISGIEFHQWLNTKYPELANRLIFITGGAFTPKTREYLAKIKNLQLEKPFDFQSLQKVIDEHMILAKKN
ncbi:MAG: PAS domain S-box protein [Deltaproteobacteria bacterium]|nr:PAS domain S-box protein [Deltaproteobacteria bacterium]